MLFVGQYHTICYYWVFIEIYNIKILFSGQSKCGSKQPCPPYIFDAHGKGFARQPDTFPREICKFTLPYNIIVNYLNHYSIFKVIWIH